ncbi:SMI1/KNR4 family protein [Nonomuraea sp. LPB2021202275-12-8]|uniref:SMI1/KNR4 family protein n=1 Tax=Nonomuraea sp. LPB2021202275-12-8 TaxID=3120159 RepID=UPI00300C5F5A
MITPHASDGPRYPWADLLRTVNGRIHERHARSVASAPPGSRHLVEAQPPPEWLGATGAGEAELARHEERFGMRLPPSYREFLQVSNGWDEESCSCLRVLPLAEVGWIRDIAPYMAVWGDSVGDMLCISEDVDGQVCLLNPHVVGADGEWQAFDLAAWRPGEIEYRSFWDLMTGMYPEFAPEDPDSSTLPDVS